jgi:DNA-3-methyladenine glycosylase I
MNRCEWPADNKPMIEYHDNEWGTPVHNDKKLFKYFVLDTFQAGLSWSMIWKKRKNFEKAFDNFEPAKVAKYGQKDFLRLMKDDGIVRNSAKIAATITNAQKFLEVRKEFGSFDKYIWQFTNHRTIHHRFKKMSEIPSTSLESDAMSRDLKKRGFKFVGSTICYAFMQGAGMVNDHTVDCFRHSQLKRF